MLTNLNNSIKSLSVVYKSGKIIAINFFTIFVRSQHNIALLHANGQGAYVAWDRMRVQRTHLIEKTKEQI